MKMTMQNKATKARYALIEIMGEMNQAGNFRNAVKLEEAISACPQESLARLYDIVTDPTYDPLGTFGKEG